MNKVGKEATFGRLYSPVWAVRRGGNILEKAPFPKPLKQKPHLWRCGREEVKEESGLHCGSKAHNALLLADFFGYFLVQRQESTARGRRHFAPAGLIKPIVPGGNTIHFTTKKEERIAFLFLFFLYA